MQAEVESLVQTFIKCYRSCTNATVPCVSDNVVTFFQAHVRLYKQKGAACGIDISMHAQQKLFSAYQYYVYDKNVIIVELASNLTQ